jgi:twitching motility protein PilT
MIDIKELFRVLVERGGSDLYLRTNAYPRARINGRIEVVFDQTVERSEMTGIANFLLASEQRRKQFNEAMDIDFIHEEPDLGRFRINIFIQRGTPSLVARHVHMKIKSFEELCLPVDILKLFCEESKGLVLVCGPAGNGKSTTIASMIEHINATQAKHIITIEDPIEFLFKDGESLINQRELGLDVPSYASALKHVTQQSPDIIYIGNIRDELTMKAAVTATELGTFVMTTFHTINAVQTIIRIINFFPPHLHDEMRMQLSMILKGSISLRLLPRSDGQGRVPAFETMVVTPTIARLIREGKINDIQGFIDKGEMFGMQSFKQSMVKLVNSGMVRREDARALADSKDDFDLALKGIRNQF